MIALDREGDLAPGPIANRIGVKAPSVTKVIARLAGQGVVRREDLPDDGRMSLVFLTNIDRDKIQAISKAQKETEKLALKGFNKKEIKQLLAMLGAIDVNLDSQDERTVPSNAAEVIIFC